MVVTYSVINSQPEKTCNSPQAMQLSPLASLSQIDLNPLKSSGDSSYSMLWRAREGGEMVPAGGGRLTSLRQVGLESSEWLLSSMHMVGTTLSALLDLGNKHKKPLQLQCFFMGCETTHIHLYYMLMKVYPMEFRNKPPLWIPAFWVTQIIYRLYAINIKYNPYFISALSGPNRSIISSSDSSANPDM